MAIGRASGVSLCGRRGRSVPVDLVDAESRRSQCPVAFPARVHLRRHSSSPRWIAYARAGTDLTHERDHEDARPGPSRLQPARTQPATASAGPTPQQQHVPTTRNPQADPANRDPTKPSEPPNPRLTQTGGSRLSRLSVCRSAGDRSDEAAQVATRPRPRYVSEGFAGSGWRCLGVGRCMSDSAGRGRGC
jgi:hypothetical protein